MAIYDLYSKRQKRLRGEIPDVYTYDTIPEPLRAQVIHIWQDALGNFYREQDEVEHWHINNSYEFIVYTLRREYGLLELPFRKHEWYTQDFIKELNGFLMMEQNHERVLDAIELSFQVIDRETRNDEYLFRENASEIADKAIEELNCRFKEHGVGFQFINGQIIRIDSELTHEEIVKPALALLHNKDFSGAQGEFLKAHGHYRHGNNCVFRAKVATDSGRNLPPIPGEGCH